MIDEDRSPSRSAINYVIAGVAVAMSAFHIYFAATLKPVFFAFYPAHLGFALALVFLVSIRNDLKIKDAAKRRVRLLSDVLLLIAGISPNIYLVLNAEMVMNRMIGYDSLTPVQSMLSIGLLVTVLEAVRRTVGLVLVVICLLFLLYAFAGPWMPGLLWHSGVSLQRLLEMLMMSQEGFFDIPLKVAADFVFLFVILGSLLLVSGAGSFFTDLAQAIAGRTVGGPAKSAIVSSALMGMLQGSSNGNVATTGPFTIPAMRRYGYRSEYAAGVEAVASTGGGLTPPIMGAAAFLMSQMTGIPYAQIMLMALIPAFLYFLAVGFMVDLEARRLKLGADTTDDTPSVFSVLRKKGHLLLPVGALIWFLLDGYTPDRAGFYAIIALAVLLIFDPEVRRRYFRVLIEAARKAPGMMVPVSMACAAAGILAGVIVRTGLNIKLGTIVLDYSSLGTIIFGGLDGQLLMGLLLTMVVAIILGMGVPTSAAYIVLASLLAPGLTGMGASVAASHLFIIYCASKSAITPPVALASYTAAAIAGSDPWRTSTIAFRLGLSVFIIPFMFVFSPALLAQGGVLETIWVLVTAMFGIFALSVGSAGWLRVDLRWYERILAIASSLPMIYAGWVTDLIGAAMFAAFLATVHVRIWRQKETENVVRSPLA